MPRKRVGTAIREPAWEHCLRPAIWCVHARCTRGTPKHTTDATAPAFPAAVLARPLTPLRRSNVASARQKRSGPAKSQSSMTCWSSLVRRGQSTALVLEKMCEKLIPSSSKIGGSSGSPSPSSVDDRLRARIPTLAPGASLELLPPAIRPAV
jgi:hypothetical protein